MIVSCKQLVQMHAIDKNAFSGVIFQTYKGSNGPCVATVDNPMTLEEAIAYSERMEDSNKPKPADEKPAAGTAYRAASAEG